MKTSVEAASRRFLARRRTGLPSTPMLPRYSGCSFCLRHSKLPFLSAGLPSWIGVCEGEAGGCCLLWFCVRFLSFCERKAALLGGLRAVRPFLDVAASVGWLLARAGAPAPSRFAALRLAPGAPRAWLLEVELHSLVASFSKCNVIVRLQFDVRIIPNNITSCESTRLRAATKTAWSSALGSTFCEWADAGYGCCFVIGDPCRFDWLETQFAVRDGSFSRRPMSFRPVPKLPKTSQSYDR